MSSWFVYLLRCADDTLYCGVTNDMEKRLAAHNSGKGAKYTRSRRPVTVAARAEVSDKSTALKLEIRTKRLPRDKKIPFLQTLEISEGQSRDAADTFCH